MIRWAFRLASHFRILDPYTGILDAIDRDLLVRWIAFFQLEPMPSDRADHREWWLAANMIAALSPNEIEEGFEQNLKPKYWQDEQAVTDPLAKAKALQNLILNNFG